MEKNIALSRVDMINKEEEEMVARPHGSLRERAKQRAVSVGWDLMLFRNTVQVYNKTLYNTCCHNSLCLWPMCILKRRDNVKAYLQYTRYLLFDCISLSRLIKWCLIQLFLEYPIPVTILYKLLYIVLWYNHAPYLKLLPLHPES